MYRHEATGTGFFSQMYLLFCDSQNFKDEFKEKSHNFALFFFH